MKDSSSAWKRFEESGNIMDYLDYRFKKDPKDSLLPYSDVYTKNHLRRTKDEIGNNGSGDKGKRFEWKW